MGSERNKVDVVAGIHSLTCSTGPQELALRRLQQAFECAHQANLDVWQFAVEIRELLQLGINSSHLRLLVCKGLVEHAVETTRVNEDRRSFRRTGKLVLRKRTCFVLKHTHPDDGAAAIFDDPAHDATPVWNAELHELSMQGQVIKHFRLPSRNQETVLAAFEEEGWPARIDDPLPPKDGQCPKQRLSETIKSLNGCQQARLIRFRGDGTGTGVCWKMRDSSARA